MARGGIGNITSVRFLRDKRVLISAAVIMLGGLGLGLGLAFTGGSSPNGTGAAGRGGVGGNSSSTSTTEAPATASSIAALPACTVADLSLSTGPGQTEAGHTGIPVVFTNRSTQKCQLTGYPTAVGYSASGEKVGTALPLPSAFVGGVGPNGVPSPIELNPGGVASAEVEAGGQPVASGGGPHPTNPTSRTTQAARSTTTTAARPCPVITKLTIGVPGDQSTTSVGTSLTDCYGFSVHPFVKGPSGSG